MAKIPSRPVQGTSGVSGRAKTPKNRYVGRARITENQFRRLLRCFALDLEAKKIAPLAGVNRNTVNRILAGIRLRISEHCEEHHQPTEHIEGGRITAILFRRFPGKGSATRHVMACLRTDGRVYARAVDSEEDLRSFEGPFLMKPELSEMALPPHTQSETKPGRLREGLPFDVLAKIKHAEHRGVLDSFWGQSMHRLGKFKGISANTFPLHLKECEFRFNNRSEDLYAVLLDIIKKKPLFWS